MARVTIEDCVDKVTNRFELVLLSGQRSRAISSGSPMTVDRDNDKNPVVALREIAEEQLNPDELREDLIESLQRHTRPEEIADADVALLTDSDGGEAVDEMTEEDLLRALRGELEDGGSGAGGNK